MAGNLIIIRGIPGSGKTTMARELLKVIDAKHFEADMFHYDEDGNYVWSHENQGKAHEWCFNQTSYWLGRGRTVIVSNTFVTQSELNKYVYKLEYASLAIFEAKGDYKSLHNVPIDTISRMKEKWYSIPKAKYESEV